MARSYSIAVIPGDGTGPEVVAEGIKVLRAVAPAEDSRSTSRATTSVEIDTCARRDTARDGSRGTEKAPRHLPRRHRAPRCQARYPGKGDPAPPAFRTGPVHQPETRETLPERSDTAEGQGPGAHRLRGGPREFGGRLYRLGRHHHEGDAPRGGGAGDDLQPVPG
jgi:hypothetical protein